MSKRTIFLKNLMEKRPSLLLEILIACTLLALCVSPLIQKPIEQYLTQLKAIKALEKERLADIAFAEIKWQLLQNEIPWKELPTKKTKAKIFPLPDIALQIPHTEKKMIQQRALLKCKKERLGSLGETVRLLEIEIEFEPFAPIEEKKTRKTPITGYVYQVIVKKHGS